jgi:uncharacterized protein (DUF2141 family)
MKSVFVIPFMLLAGLAQPAAAQAVYGDAAACAPGASGPAVLAYFDGLKDRKGKIRLELFPDNDKDFLEDDFVLTNAGKVFKRIEMATPQSGPVAVCMKIPRAGRYTMAMIHDRDGLRKFSFSIDGIGFPGNPKLGWSKPKAAKAVVNIGPGLTTMHVILNYFRGFGFGPIGSAK